MADIIYTCRGPRYSPEEQQTRRQDHATETIRRAEQKRDRYKTEVPGTPTESLPSVPTEEEALAIASRLDLTGPGCGKDITDLIMAVPEDGEEHHVICPACGTVASVRRTPVQPENGD